MIFNAVSRSRAAFSAFVGQVQRRSAPNSSGWRKFCSKPQEPCVPTQERAGFKMPGYSPSEMDKRMLVWSGRFKSKEQIPQFVSFEMIDAARNRVRVKACYVMIVLTLAGCVWMIVLGKRAAGRHDSLITRNMERKARLREEAQKDLEVEAALNEKKMH
ncbi:protein FAM162B [Clarias gariepinus]|uniref:protein FAM162B n=1 Tax=Clarias gariepinus TaxID=13013 RepID=UPI00234D2231|nr:protein FAM162B [Clarias gariepinus]